MSNPYETPSLETAPSDSVTPAQAFLKPLLIGQWIVFGAAVASEFIFPLPVALQEYQTLDNPTGTELVGMLVIMTAIGSYILATILLLLGKRPARWLYLAAQVLMVLSLTLVQQASVTHSITESISFVHSCLIGATLFVLFALPREQAHTR